MSGENHFILKGTAIKPLDDEALISTWVSSFLEKNGFTPIDRPLTVRSFVDGRIGFSSVALAQGSGLTLQIWQSIKKTAIVNLNFFSVFDIPHSKMSSCLYEDMKLYDYVYIVVDSSEGISITENGSYRRGK